MSTRSGGHCTMLAALGALASLSACGAPEGQMAAPSSPAAGSAQPPAPSERPVPEAVVTNPPCSAAVYQMLDAIHFTCNEGRGFTVHYEDTSWCAVVSAGGEGFVLPQTKPWPDSLNTDGQVEFRVREDQSASLRGAAGGPYENCHLVE